MILHGCSLLSVLKISQYDKSPDGLNLAFIPVHPESILSLPKDQSKGGFVLRKAKDVRI